MPNDILQEIERHLQQEKNLANVFRELNLLSKIGPDALPPVIHASLIQNRSYAYLSFNLSTAVPHWQILYRGLESMVGFDSVVVYHQSEEDIFLINPRESNHWEEAGRLVPDSLVVVYTCAVPNRDRDQEESYLQKFRSICDGKIDTSLTPEAPSQTLHPKQQPIRATPRYAVPVTNGFFHYGNVEAWQNIIESYQRKYIDLKVQIFFREEPVYRISSLFKWGKVSVGDVIHFSVVGSEFKHLSKLKKYLTMAASPHFMPFIRKNVNNPLDLF